MSVPVDTTDPDGESIQTTSPPFGVALLQAGIAHASALSPESFDQAEMIDAITALETVKHAVDALQAEWTRAFARAHVAAQTANGVVEPEKLERSVAAQVGAACRVSPTEGRKRVRTARDLHDGLDHLRGLFGDGEVSAYKVSTVVGALSHLDAAERAEVDRQLADRDIARLGVGRLRDLARMLAAQVAPDKFVKRCAAARSGRRVTLRPSADGMTDLIAHLPAEQGAACYAALQKAVNEAAVNPAPQTRGRGQIMADTLVERVTGQTTADAVNVEVQIVVPIEALIGPDSPLPAEIPGHGPVPADLIATTAGRKAWRRLTTTAGIVLGGDSRQRKFTGLLADLIRARDRYRCAEPYCDAPIREADHVVRWADGGPTEFGNGRGLCQFHNQIRELPGWRAHRNESDDVHTTTPTGHTYVSRPQRR